ncbi:helix-turn-helix transcriptional regulator [Nocardia sp. NEAU-G5]|uniref:Helix-turn-helix transcriptional regulator n=1 Tax=Nocardia albiluteola TaxID=2842303 RepID=A0ABS6B3V5_9NOCA|nr:helix-turn-helix transcriptional regulator [Nocardia albiluteola]
MEPVTSSPPVSFADRLNQLLDERAARTGVAMSLSQFAADLQARTGVILSKAYVAALRKGQAPEPRLDVVRGLARYFGVKPAYFLDGTPDLPEEIPSDLAAAMRRSGIRQIGLRAAGLSDESLRHLIGIVDNIRALEGLPPHPGDTDS